MAMMFMRFPLSPSLNYCNRGCAATRRPTALIWAALFKNPFPLDRCHTILNLMSTFEYRFRA